MFRVGDYVWVKSYGSFGTVVAKDTNGYVAVVLEYVRNRIWVIPENLRKVK